MRFIRLKELESLTGLSGTTIWRKEKGGTFPKRRKISMNSVAWLVSEVEEWMKKCPQNHARKIEGNHAKR